MEDEKMTNNNNNQNNIDILKDLRQGFAECFNRSRQITENINSSRGHLNTLNLRFTAEAKATIYSQQDELVDDLNQLTADAKKQFNILDREIRSGNNITNDFINDATINLMELNHRVNEADAKRDYLTAYFHGNFGEYKNGILLKIDEINHVIKNIMLL